MFDNMVGNKSTLMAITPEWQFRIACCVAIVLAAVLGGGGTPSTIVVAFVAVMLCAGSPRASKGGASANGDLSIIETALRDHFFVLRADRDGRFIEANDKYLARIGYSLGELGEQPRGGLSSDSSDASYLAEMWSTVQSGKTWAGDFCDVARDGSCVWISAVVIPNRDTNGNIVSLTTIGVDVTGVRKAKENIDTANARLQAFIKHAPTALAMFDRNMNYVAHTDRWVSDYKLADGNLVGQNHYDVFPELSDDWKTKHQRILAGATERYEEEIFKRADGTENIIRWEGRPWLLPDGVIGGMMMLTEDISAQKQIKDRLWKLAKVDTLTSLPNRLSFGELLNSEIQFASLHEKQFAVGLLDVDNLKEINDTLGHDVGDQVLQQIAFRLESSLREFGTVARLGGDEFAILVVGPDRDAAFQAAQRAFAMPFKAGAFDRVCSASIGVTKFPDDAEDAGDLLKNADLALYRAKSEGRGRAVFFKPELRSSMRRRVELQQEALIGIKEGQFLLYFQPVVPADRSALISYEALLRWRHPSKGILSPPQFAEIFDDMKLATLIGERVIDMAIGQAEQWLASSKPFGRIAINVTSADFALGCPAARLREILELRKVPPSKLCIEVTEHVFLGSGSAHVGDALHRITEMGVEVALDDFGTGYASLTHLKSFPIGRIKIDRSFVQDMLENKESLSIVNAIVQLANGLGIGVTAEGVERFEQLEHLQRIGCSSFQGYLFSRPQPPEGITVVDLWNAQATAK